MYALVISSGHREGVADLDHKQNVSALGKQVIRQIVAIAIP
jgi:hypothetical protein